MFTTALSLYRMKVMMISWRFGNTPRAKLYIQHTADTTLVGWVFWELVQLTAVGAKERRKRMLWTVWCIGVGVWGWCGMGQGSLLQSGNSSCQNSWQAWVLPSCARVLNEQLIYVMAPKQWTRSPYRSCLHLKLLGITWYWTQRLPACLASPYPPAQPNRSYTTTAAAALTPSAVHHVPEYFFALSLPAAWLQASKLGSYSQRLGF